MWRRVGLAVACLAGTLAACAVIDPVDSRYDTISRSLAKARNESILLNLARASHDYPLSFATIANVTPSLTNTSTFGLPSFLLGPGLGAAEPQFTPGREIVFGNTTASNSTSISTNFNVSTQETSVFYSGFLKPVDLLTLDYFIRQGYSRELLFWLFTQSVEADRGIGRSLLFSYQPPDDYGCPLADSKKRCFEEFVLIAVYAGLTLEQRSVQRSSSGRSKDNSSGGGSSKSETTSFFRFCFDPLLAERAQNAMGPARKAEAERYLDFRITPALLKPRCGSEWDPRATANRPQKDSFEFFVGPVRFRVLPRSAFGIFVFLGTLIKMQRDNPPAWSGANTWGRLDVLAPPTLKTVHDDENLFKVDFSGTANCFARTWFLNENFCIPEEAQNSKRIFNLLAQLIAIETAASDLSITPSVRIIQ
jgi:hypothetical protein